jgi:hypothetical protein
MFEAGRMPDESPPAAAPRSAVTGRFVRQQEGSHAPKRDRRLRLTRVDKRSVAGQRIAELNELFTASLGDRPLTPMLAMRIAEASELKALAEKARGDYLRGGFSDLDELVRLERRADQAVRSLGISEAKREKPPTVLEYLEARDARMAAEQ